MERQPYTRLDVAIIIILFIIALIAGLLMAWNVNGRIPHLEDEIAYLFQARIYMRGELWAPVPKTPSPFFTPFVINLDGGKRVGKYPIGWPLLLAVGEKFGAGWLVNPILGGLTIVLIYMLARELFDRQIGLMSGLLAISSPLFLIQSSTYMSHASACFWAALLAWAFLRADLAREQGRVARGWVVVAGMCIGMLAITRALSALGVVFPFVLVLLVRLIRQPRSIRLMIADYWPMALIAGLLVALQYGYVYALTGDPTTNLYLKIWKYDTIGFGPQFGRGGHTIQDGLRIAGRDTLLFASDLFGWEKLSLVPLVPGLILSFFELKRERRFWIFLLFAPALMLVIVHMAYWIGAQLYGPRYYYESLPGLAILSALGIRSPIRGLAEGAGKRLGWIKSAVDRPGRLGGLLHPYGLPAYLLLASLIAANGVAYLPERLKDWHNLYAIVRAPVDRFEELRHTDHVLILVRGSHWPQYAPFFFYNSPWLDGPIVAAHDNTPTQRRDALNLFPDREVWFYNANTGQFTKLPTPVKTEP